MRFLYGRAKLACEPSGCRADGRAACREDRVEPGSTVSRSCRAAMRPRKWPLLSRTKPMKPDIIPFTSWRPFIAPAARIRHTSTKPELHVEICSACHPFYTASRARPHGGRVEPAIRWWCSRSSTSSAYCSFDPAAGVDELLLARVEGMAGRADLDVQLGLRRTRDEFVAARAMDGREDVIGVNVRSSSASSKIAEATFGSALPPETIETTVEPGSTRIFPASSAAVAAAPEGSHASFARPREAHRRRRSRPP